MRPRAGDYLQTLRTPRSWLRYTLLQGAIWLGIVLGLDYLFNTNLGWLILALAVTMPFNSEVLRTARLRDLASRRVAKHDATSPVTH